MRVEIDHSQCILCGICEGLCPEVFKQDSTVEITQERISENYARCYVACEACPMECIKLQE